MKKDKIVINASLAASIHPELIQLTDKISRQHKLKNGKTSLYWHLVAVVDQHIRQESFKKLSK